VLLNLLIAMMATTYNNVTEQSDLEFKMQRAIFIKSYSRDARWLPPPFLTIGLVSMKICELFLKSGAPAEKGTKKEKGTSKAKVSDTASPKGKLSKSKKTESSSLSSRKMHQRQQLGLIDVGNGAAVHWAEQFTAAKKQLTLFKLRQAIRDFRVKEKERKEHRKQMRDFMAMQQAGKQAEIYRQLQDIEFSIPNKVKTAVENVAAEHNDYLGTKLQQQMKEDAAKSLQNANDLASEQNSLLMRETSKVMLSRQTTGESVGGS
jgi:hypothetical protein